MSMTSSLLLLLFIYISVHCAEGQLYLGDTCTIRQTNNKGVCRYDSDCPGARRQFLFSRVRPTICGFEGVQSIICCENEGSTTTTTTTTTTTRPNRQTSRPFDETIQPNRSPVNNRGTSDTSISEQKCSEYSSQVTTTLEALPLLPDPEPLNFTVAHCDYTSSPLIVGGEEADVGEFPHMAVIGWETVNSREYSWLCGGSLISDNYVLTAGHCTSFDRNTNIEDDEPKVVRLGEHNLKRRDDGANPQDIRIVEIIKHPEYRSPVKYHDIALLRLEKAASFNNFVRPACLWQTPTFPQDSCIATGWGRINFAEDPSDVLLKVSLKVIEVETCKNLFRNNINRNFQRGVISEQLCAGDLKGGKDTCQGDSGGPLQVSDTSNRCIFRIIGVTSFGTGCGGRNTPAIYTRISSYVPWIESVVWG